MHRMDENMPFLLRYENVAWYDERQGAYTGPPCVPGGALCGVRDVSEVRQAVADMVTQSTGPYAAVAMGMVLAAKAIGKSRRRRARGVLAPCRR